LTHPLDRQIEELEGSGIRPVRVLEREQDRPPAGETLELIEQCRERPASLLHGAERQRRIPLAERDRQQRRKKRRYSFNPRCAHGEERFQLVEALLGGVVGLETCRSLQLGNERTKRAVGVVGRALVTQARVRLAGDALGERRHKTGFADPRLARDQHDLPFALPSEALPLQQEIELVLAVDEIGQTRRAGRLEAALGIGYAFDRPRCDRLGNTLDLVPPKVAQTEQIPEQAARGGGDDDRPRLRQSLKARCKVRRVPDHGVLAQRTLAAEVADHHQTGRDADADRERFRGARLEPRNRGNDIEARPHGSLGIVFVRAGIAEIGQYSVAPELGKEAVISSRNTGAGGVIGIDHGAHVLRIEAGRQGGRAHQIADHHGEVTAFGLVTQSRFGRCFSRCRSDPIELRDRAQNPAAMPKQNAEILEVLFRQIADDREVNAVVGEPLGVLTQADRC